MRNLFSFHWNDGRPWGGFHGAAALLQPCPDFDRGVYLRSIPACTPGRCQQGTAECDGFPRERRHDERQRASSQPLPRVLSRGCSFFLFFFCCHHSWHTCRLYYQQSPGLQETHGNWLSGLAPSLHLANACRPRPPDVTFPDDGKRKKKRKKTGLSISRLVFSHTFCPTCDVSFEMFSSC